MELRGRAESCWVDTAPETHYPAYAQSDRADVAVIGAGIVGLTSAYLLARAGYAVTVLEARNVGRQVTGRSTAKITAQHATAPPWTALRRRFITAQFSAEPANGPRYPIKEETP